ncbi:MAG: cell division protein FtsX [Pseudomonadota bacterium]
MSEGSPQPAASTPQPLPQRLRLVPGGGWGAALATLAAAGMAFLAMLSLVAGLAAADLAATWQRDLQGSATVRLSAPDATSLDRVMDVLRRTDGVAAARALAAEDQAALLAPWLGEGAALSDLPIPQLIDVTLAGAGPDVDRLAAALEAASPGTVYDDHGAWRGPLLEAAAAIRNLAVAAVALIAGAAAGITALAARASLAGNAEIVRVVRLIGGRDSFIVRAFVRPLVWRTGLGAGAGAILGAVVLAALPEAGAALGLTIAPGLGSLFSFAAAVAGAGAIIGWAAAQLAVRAALRELP